MIDSTVHLPYFGLGAEHTQIFYLFIYFPLLSVGLFIRPLSSHVAGGGGGPGYDRTDGRTDPPSA